MLHRHEYLYAFSPALIYRRLNKIGGSLQKILYNQMFKVSLTYKKHINNTENVLFSSENFVIFWS